MKKILLIVILATFLITGTAHAYLNIVFSIDRKPVPQAVKDKLSEVGCEWVILNIRNNRILIDAIIPTRNIAIQLKDYLVANDYNPKLIALTKVDGCTDGQEYTYDEEGNITGVTGEPTYVFDSVEYLDLMPDEITYDSEGNIILSQRPVTIYEIHNFMGWEKRYILQ